VALLQGRGITALCDVRSTPYSRVNPQFNREPLKEHLRSCRIKYVFLGAELGGRSEDASCYEGGKIRYERLAHTGVFRLGLDRLKRGMGNYTLTLMCAEKEPLDCHRTILVSRHLAAAGVEVFHIHADGSLESHSDALVRLTKALDLRRNEHDLFRSNDDLQAEAYRLQEQRIAYQHVIADPGKRTLKSAAG